MRIRSLLVGLGSVALISIGVAAGLAGGGAAAPGSARPVTAVLAPAAPSAVAAKPPRKETSGAVTEPEWKKVERLISEQKMSAAQDLVDRLLAGAEGTADTAAWTRGLIAGARLRAAGGGYETAAKFLKQHAWPQDLLSRATLDLVYAQTLTAYYQTYSWEINRRERVESAGPVDLRVWTREQIHAAAIAAYAEAWQHRSELGAMPVARLKPYLVPNDFPERVRGTLRDALSYLFVELLADTSLWSPAQSNDLYRLDLEALIAGSPASAEAALADPGVHPLVKLGAVLADLESWHQGRGEREAMLEARLERATRLYEAFTQEADKARVRVDLEGRLPAFRNLPWWSEGVATLAGLLEGGSSPSSLRHAHELSLQGEKAYPGTHGSQRCAALRSRIEAPDFSLSAMASDAPGKRSIEVGHKNLPHLYFRAYAVDLVDRLERQAINEPFPQGRDATTYARASKVVAEWTSDLPATPDFRSHRTFVVPPMAAPGAYLVLVSARPDFAAKNNRVLSLGLILGDLVLSTTAEGSGESKLRVLSGGQGEPVPGIDVTVYRRDWQRGPQRELRSTTDAQGFVVLPARADNTGWWGGLALAKRGADVALQEVGLPYAGRPAATESTLLFTDRSVYRPQQTLRFKVLAYGGEQREGRLAVRANAAVTVTLTDPNGQEVVRASFTTNRFGTAAGEFTIPAGRPLGQWWLAASPSGGAAVRVEEYKRPTFEVLLKAPQDALRLNRPGKLRGEARYYFGLPVAAGTARWQVTRQPVLPDWWSWWGWSGWWGGGAPPAQVVAAGQSPLGEDGTFNVEFIPAADERAAGAADLSYQYRLSADVTDEGGETRSAERSFRLGIVAVQARVESETGYFRAGEKAALTLVRTDLDGEPRPGSGAWTLAALAQPAAPLMPADEPARQAPVAGTAEPEFATPGDGLRARWTVDSDWRRTVRGWADGREIAKGELTHDAKGEAALALPPLAPGAYRLRYETVDPFGAKAMLQHEFVVAGPGLALALPALLLPETPSVKVGGTARFLVHSGFAGQALFLETYRDGSLIARRRVAAGVAEIEVPITAAERGGFAVRLTMLRDHQLLQPTAGFAVPWDDRALEVSFSTFRDRLRPGGRETFQVKVSRADGASEIPAAEVLAYMYDRSLDLFAPHNPPRPLALFPSRMTLGWSSSSLGQRPSGWVSQDDWATPLNVAEWSPDRLALYDDEGIGGPGLRLRRGRLGGVEGGVVAGVAAPVPMPQSMALQKSVASREAYQEFDALADKPKQALAFSAGTTPPPAELRSNFAETAFWQPALLTGADGVATIEFTVPDSVTSWRVWAHAVTADFRSGSASRETQSVKDLMVRPYLPRFLREGDTAELKVVLNNASKSDLAGTLQLELFDPLTNASLLGEFGVDAAAARRAFTVKANGSSSFAIAVHAPRRVGEVAVKVTAVSGNLSDGELRPLPLLPSRMHLAQSRFVALRGKQQLEMKFADLALSDDSTRINEQMVVTVDAQLFYGVLQALPYLVDYPYECTEQTLNRFLSTGIVSSLFGRYPSVAKMAQQLARRDTQFETFDGADPNRKMALEETPWLELSHGNGTKPGLPSQIDSSEGEPNPSLVRVLDPRVARAERSAALAKLAKAQLPSGAFPWWPGGPPSDYMTLYLMYGFAKAAEFGVEVPKDMVQRGWQYLGQRYREDFQRQIDHPDCDCNWEFLTFLNYVASSYPDPSVMNDAIPQEERVRMLDASYRHWKQHSPYLKGFLALTLKRMGRPQNAKLVFDSVMDSAKTTADEGTFWAPEERAWLWYNDTIESHAFALRALMELEPDDPRQEGLVQWLFLNKKLNHWKSTRATAEVLYSVAKYLEHTNALGVREVATVHVAGQDTTFTFEPDRYTGKKNQIVVPGERLGPQAATVTVEKDTPGILFASTTWHFSTDELPKEDRGDLFMVSRQYFKRLKSGKETVLQPLAQGAALAVGDEIEVQLSLKSKAPAEYVHLRDPRAAGLEPENVRSGWVWNTGLARYEEVHDSGNNFFIEWLPQGEYTLKYRLRANLAGTFRVGPATVQSMYAPEFTAYSAGNVLVVKGD